MKKIVFLDQYNTSGGGQTILVNLIYFALDFGFKVEVWIPKGAYFQHVFKDESRIQIKEIDSPTLNFARKGFINHIYWIIYSFSFLRHLPKLKGADIIYVNGPRLSLAAIILSIVHPGKYYYHLHLLHTGMEKAIFKLARKMPRTEYLFFGSEFILERFDSKAKHFKSIVFNGFLSAHFSLLPFVPRFNSLNTTSGSYLNFMLLARVYEGKGHDLFLKLAADFPKYKFYIIGETVDQHYYKMLKSKATSNVFFTYSDDVSKLVNGLNINISIMSSMVEESFGLASIESMAMSCLTIVSDKGNLPYQAQNTGSWVFSNYEQVKSMIERIETMDDAEINSICHEQYLATKRYYDFTMAKEQFGKLVH